MLVEDQDCCLTVAPGEVAQELVDGSSEFLTAPPDLALCNKCGAVIVLNPNVCLATTAKSFSGSSAFVMPVKVRQYDVPQPFLVMHRVSLWRCLKGAAFMSNDC